jgi:hypothetical protein
MDIDTQRKTALSHAFARRLAGEGRGAIPLAKASTLRYSTNDQAVSMKRLKEFSHEREFRVLKGSKR